MVIKKGDFIELDYVGRLKEEGKIFDLTSEAVARKEGLYHDHQQYGPQIICVGEGGIVKGLDAFLIGKQTGTHTLSLTPDEAFGKKNAKLIKIIPISTFKKQQMRPFPGLQVNIDGFMGIIKTVSGGRVIVDFNHPIAGRDVVYEVTVKRVVTEAKEKIKAYLKMNVFGRDIPFTFDKGTLAIQLPLPEEMRKPIVDKIKDVIPDVKDVAFEEIKEKEKKATTQQ